MPRLLAPLLAVLAIVPCGPAIAADDGRPLPLRYDVDVRWAPGSRALTGTESIEFRNEGPGTLPVVWLRLWANDSIPGHADGCRHPGIRIRMLAGAAIARYAVSCSAVALRLPRPLAPGQTAAVTLELTARAPRGEALFGRSQGVDLFGRVLPSMAVRDDLGWHLNPDTQVGDPAYSLAAVWHAALRMPRSLDAASTGREVSNGIDPGTGERVLVADTEHARDFGFAIGHLRRRTARVAGVRVRVFSSSRTPPAAAQRALRSAGKSVGAYSRWFGEYGAPELDLVLTALGDASQELPEIVFTDPDRATVAHEVAHQWFYAIVGSDQYRSPWLDESFASWGEAQIAPGYFRCDRRDPLGPFRGWLTRGLGFYERRPDDYADVVYERGECALSVLARDLGRGRFIGLLAAIVSRYRWGVMDSGDFLEALRAASPRAARRWSRLVADP